MGNSDRARLKKDRDTAVYFFCLLIFRWFLFLYIICYQIHHPNHVFSYLKFPALKLYVFGQISHNSHPVTSFSKTNLVTGVRVRGYHLSDFACQGPNGWLYWTVFLLERSWAILASSSESEDGGTSPPPCKKQRVSATTMQANGCPQHNGESSIATSSQQNGSCTTFANGDFHIKSTPRKPMSQTDQDIVRLIVQHLRGLGLK